MAALEELLDEIRFLAESEVTSWDLSRNEAGDEGARLVAEKLAANPTVHMLDLSRNSIGDEGIGAIAGLLRANAAVHTIGLRANAFGDEGLRTLLETLRASRSITEVDLSKNPISDEGARLIGETLKANPTIRTIKLDECGITAAGVKALLRALEGVASLPRIKLDDAFEDLQSAEGDADARRLIRQEGVQRALRATALEGRAPLLRSRLMLIGEGFSGKTATFNSLAGVPLEAHEKNTLGAAVCQCDGHPLGAYDFWPIRRDLTTEAQQLWAAAAIARLRAEEAGDPDAAHAPAAAAGSSGPPIEESIEMARSLKAEAEGGKRPLRVVVWDCGSQRAFNHLYPAWFTDCTVYVVVFSLDTLQTHNTSVWRHPKRWIGGEEPLDARQRAGLRELRAWLTALLVAAPTAPVLLVGTHKDKLVHPERLAQVDAVISHTMGWNGDGPHKVAAARIVRNKADRLWYFPVDNLRGVKEEPVKRLKDALRTTILRQEHLLEETPISTLRLLTALASSGRPFLPLDVAQVIGAAEAGAGDPEDLVATLGKLHALGLVMWWPTEPLRQYVVLDSQWLVDAIMCLLRDHRKAKKPPGTPQLVNDLERLQTQGLLSKDLLEFLWPAYSYDDAAQSFLLEMLTHFLLLCDWPSGRRHQWLLPSLVVAPTAPPACRLTPWAKSQTILVDFEEPFLPPGLFHRLICHSLQSLGGGGGGRSHPPMVGATDAWLILDKVPFQLLWDDFHHCIRVEIVPPLHGPEDANHRVLEHVRRALEHLAAPSPALRYTIRVPSARGVTDAMGRPQYCALDDLGSAEADGPFAHWLPSPGLPEDVVRVQMDRLVAEAPDQGQALMQAELEAYQRDWKHIQRADSRDLKDLTALLSELQAASSSRDRDALRQPSLGATDTSTADPDYLDRLYDACTTHRAAFEQRMATLSGKVAAVTFQGPAALKPVGRCLEKAFFKYGGDVARVLDVIRCRAVAKEAYSAVQLLRRLASEVRAATDGLRVAAVRSTLLDEYPAGRESAGWRGITVFLLIPEGGGILGEFQVHLRPFTDAFAQFAAGSGIPGAPTGLERYALFRRIKERHAFEAHRSGRTVSPVSPPPPSGPEESPCDAPVPSSGDSKGKPEAGGGVRGFFSKKLHLSRKRS